MQASAGWQSVTREGRAGLERACLLPDFASVRRVVSALMALADELDHHPEVSFGYRELSVRWSSHDVGGISARDHVAAARTDALLDVLA